VPLYRPERHVQPYARACRLSGSRWAGPSSGPRASRPAPLGQSRRNRFRRCRCWLAGWCSSGCVCPSGHAWHMESACVGWCCRRSVIHAAASPGGASPSPVAPSRVLVVHPGRISSSSIGQGYLLTPNRFSPFMAWHPGRNLLAGFGIPVEYVARILGLLLLCRKPSVSCALGHRFLVMALTSAIGLQGCLWTETVWLSCLLR
jgi:hypothetical protein